VIIHELIGHNENHPVYQALEISNGNRQYEFLKSIVAAALQVQRPFLSHHIIKALNFQAITCLHTNAGEYRPCPVTVGDFLPPDHYRVESLMDDFINMVNRSWETADPVTLSAYCLWRLNSVHPFINGNGRTARATCYFVLCVKAGGWLPGQTILPELIRRDRPQYIEVLKQVDASAAQGELNLTPLHAFLSKLLDEQLKGSSSLGNEAPAAAPEPPPAA
jgi:prophage maintenance system killer protein